MDTDGVIQLFIIIFLICIAAFFSAAETAYTTVSKIRLKSLSEEGNKAAALSLRILDKFRKMLSAVLIGNNVVNLTASAVTTALAIRLWGNVAAGIATGILTFIIILGAEILPKTLASIYAEKLVLAFAMLVLIIMKILTPVIFIVDKIAFYLLKAMRIDQDYREMMTERELRKYVDVSHEDGAIETDERTMINNVFDFSDTKARDVMIPRIDMVAVSADANYYEILAVIKENMYTRLPVYREDKDIIIGLINIKDLFSIEDERRDGFRASEILREAYYTYELKKTDDLMDEMRKQLVNMAFVLDEYGLTVGMITLEDLLEEIVGEIRDEYDGHEEDFIRKVDENVYLIEGGVKLDDINDALGTSLDSEDYDSIGGLMIESLVRLPEDNEVIMTSGGISLKAQGIIKNRISKVLVTLPDTASLDLSEKNAPQNKEQEKTPE